MSSVRSGSRFGKRGGYQRAYGAVDGLSIGLDTTICGGVTALNKSYVALRKGRIAVRQS